MCKVGLYFGYFLLWHWFWLTFWFIQRLCGIMKISLDRSLMTAVCAAGGQFNQRGAECRRSTGSFQRSNNGSGRSGSGWRGQVCVIPPLCLSSMSICRFLFPTLPTTVSIIHVFAMLWNSDGPTPGCHLFQVWVFDLSLSVIFLALHFCLKESKLMCSNFHTCHNQKLIFFMLVATEEASLSWSMIVFKR